MKLNRGYRTNVLFLMILFEHEVLHNGKKDRIVFIVDLWHPQIKDSYVNILKLDEFKNFGKL